MRNSTLLIVVPLKIIVPLVFEFEVLHCVSRELHCFLLIFKKSFVMNVLDLSFLTLGKQMLFLCNLIDLSPRGNFGGLVFILTALLVLIVLAS